MNDCASFGTRLKSAIKMRGLSQNDFAGLTGVGVWALSRYVNGKRIPSTRMVTRFAKALNITSDYLLGLSESANSVEAKEDERTTRLVREYSRPNVYADLWLHCEACGAKVYDKGRYYYCPICGAKVKEQEGYERLEET